MAVPVSLEQQGHCDRKAGNSGELDASMYGWGVT